MARDVSVDSVAVFVDTGRGWASGRGADWRVQIGDLRLQIVVSFRTRPEGAEPRLQPREDTGVSWRYDSIGATVRTPRPTHLATDPARSRFLFRRLPVPQGM